jgi:hypothetical protein
MRRILVDRRFSLLEDRDDFLIIRAYNGPSKYFAIVTLIAGLGIGSAMLFIVDPRECTVAFC